MGRNKVSAKLQDIALVYEGSVKKVYKLPAETDRMWFEYTDDYSVFDWGKMPDTIENKGRALAIMGAYFFERLNDSKYWKDLPQSSAFKRFNQDWLNKRWNSELYRSKLLAKGASSHYRGLVKSSGSEISWREAATTSGAPYLQVLPAEVERPEPFVLIAQTVYYYPRRPSTAPRRLVPLEVVFRFGMPAGSSLKTRLEKDPDYATVLGLESVPKPGEWFDRPVLEFFTKLEPKDRLLSIQEALLISNLTPEQFEQLIEFGYALSLGLFNIFAEKGIELWDGKFEFAISDDGLMLVDSIGPDELRLLYKGTHLSKEMIRQVYRGSKWEQSIKEAQDIARHAGKHDWKAICIEKLQSQPEPLPANFKQIIDQLYGSLTNHLVGEQIFPEQPNLDEFVTAVAARK
jgi:phosphoribosylaminoimidazole-succinocarboxamide synthase